MSLARVFVVGGAGFIGSHFVRRLLLDDGYERITVFDNFSSGSLSRLPEGGSDRLRIVSGDVKDVDALTEAMADAELVIHLASNPDIARAATEPAVDFDEGTLLTHHVVEAMRLTGASTIVYASGSGVYGDLGELEIDEDHGPLAPISTYGASKLAGEALICSYCHLFGITARVFRFANVVGPQQTHGVGFDFLRRLQESPARLRILGDGTQSKSYVHVDDVIDAAFVALAKETERYRVYNVATGDYITVSEIAELAVECAGLPAGGTRFEFAGGDRGWAGDVPVVRLNSDRIRALGWHNRLSSREALRASMLAMRAEREVQAAC